jgi:hypothetical protein
MKSYINTETALLKLLLNQAIILNYHSKAYKNTNHGLDFAKHNDTVHISSIKKNAVMPRENRSLKGSSQGIEILINQGKRRHRT